MSKSINISEDWNETKKKLKLKFANLVDSDVFLIDDEKEEMMQRLQLKLGKTKEEINKLITEL